MADFTINSIDISGLPQAPSVKFTFVDDDLVMEASPPGGHLRVESMSANGEVSRVVITNTLTNEVFADVVSHQHETPSVGEEWGNSALYAAELACALYWSMWRMQQVKSLRLEEKADA